LQQTLRFLQANLSFMDSSVDMLDRFGTMAVEFALGMRHMIPGGSQRR
jgi:hypothetical protein